jgi:putative N6-adenine-specific DNA methylase
LRTAHRVLWVLAEVDAGNQDQLYRSLRERVRWNGLVTPEHTIAVHATVKNSVFRNSQFVALKTKDAIVDTVRDEKGARPSVDKEDPAVRVHIRVKGNMGIVSIDAAGESLHARGYRLKAGAAPMRETMAAGALLLDGWRGECPVIDPMCGSGTLIIEAALLAQRHPPGLARARFGFERWPGHREEVFARIRENANLEQTRPIPRLFGSDRDGRVVSIAQDNARRAGVSDITQWATGDMAKMLRSQGEPGIVLTNPPYGERMGEIESHANLYRDLGQLLQRRFQGWRALVFLAHEAHEDAMGLTPQRSWNLQHGPLQVRLNRYVID